MTLTRIRNIGVDPQAGIDASKLTYLFTNTGADPVGTLLSDIFTGGKLNAKVHFGAKGDGETDDTAALNRALDKCFALGRPLYLPAGHYRVSQVNSAYCLLNKGVSMYGDGPLRTIISFADTVPGTIDMMRVEPVGAGTDFLSIENIMWWPGYPNFDTLVRGRRCIHFNFNAAGINTGKLRLFGNYFMPSNDYSVESENNTSLLPQGNPSNSVYEHNEFWGGVKLSSIGDSNVFRNNIVRSPVSLRTGITIFVVNGGGGTAGHNVIRDNNIDCPGGAIVLLNGRQYIIDGNNIEISAGAGSSSQAVIDIDGSSGLILNCSITNNRVGIQGTSTAKNGIRLNAVSGANVGENQLDLGTGAASTTGLLITGNSISARLGRNGYGGSWSAQVANSGSDTKSISYA